jgi:hypothetical protein
LSPTKFRERLTFYRNTGLERKQFPDSPNIPPESIPFMETLLKGRFLDRGPLLDGSNS